MDEVFAPKSKLVKQDAVEDQHDLRHKLLTRQYRVKMREGDKRFTSKVWQVFGVVERDTGDIVPHVVACRKCSRVFKFRSNTTSNLIKHKCFLQMKGEVDRTTAQTIANIESETKKNLENIILQWTIESCRPIDVFEDTGLQRFAEFLIATGAKYGPNVDMDELFPQLSKITQCVEKRYIDYVEKFKVEISSIRKVGFGLTVDLLKDEYVNVSYLFVTIHYIKSGESFNRLLGLHSIEGDKCTNEDITTAAERILKKFGCTLENNAVIVKGKSEIMAEAFQMKDHTFCLNNVLQSALEKAIEETTEIRTLCEVSNNIFNFLKDVSNTFISNMEVISSKRWNTIYYMLSAISENWYEAESHLSEHVELKQITELLKVLEPFEEASRELESECGPTLHLAIVHIHRLRKLCVKKMEDIEIIKKFKVNLLHFFETIVWKNISVYHKIALYLFPPANKLLSFSQSDKDLVRTECKKLMETYIDDETAESDVVYSALQVDDKNAIIEFFNAFNDEDEKSASTSSRSMINPDLFNDFVEPTERENSAEDKVSSEMRLYEETSVSLRDNFNLLHWWYIHRSQFPLLYKTSCKILAVPATGAASAKAILKARPLLFENRNTIDVNPDSVNEILFLHCNADKIETVYEVNKDEKFLISTNIPSV